VADGNVTVFSHLRACNNQQGKPAGKDFAELDENLGERGSALELSLFFSFSAFSAFSDSECVFQPPNA
jgi:hypothetical protein